MQDSEIEFLPFIIPKVHSTPLRIDSAHLDHLCSLTEDDALKGHISEVHDGYPPSTRIHAPL